MVEIAAKAAWRGLEQLSNALKQALTEAEAALAAGDPQEGERRAKAVSALARAAREVIDLESLARAQPPEDNEEALRAELRRRLARLVAAEHAGFSAEPVQHGGAEASAD